MTIPEDWSNWSDDEKYEYTIAFVRERMDAAKPECRKTPLTNKSGKITKPATVPCGSGCRQPKNCKVTKGELRTIRRRMKGASKQELAEAVKAAIAAKKSGKSSTGAVYGATKGALGQQGRQRLERKKQKGEGRGGSTAETVAQVQEPAVAETQPKKSRKGKPSSQSKGKASKSKGIPASSLIDTSKIDGILSTPGGKSGKVVKLGDVGKDGFASGTVNIPVQNADTGEYTYTKKQGGIYGDYVVTKKQDYWTVEHIPSGLVVADQSSRFHMGTGKEDSLPFGEKEAKSIAKHLQDSQMRMPQDINALANIDKVPGGTDALGAATIGGIVDAVFKTYPEASRSLGTGATPQNSSVPKSLAHLSSTLPSSQDDPVLRFVQEDGVLKSADSRVPDLTGQGVYGNGFGPGLHQFSKIPGPDRQYEMAKAIAVAKARGYEVQVVDPGPSDKPKKSTNADSLLGEGYFGLNPNPFDKPLWRAMGIA